MTKIERNTPESRCELKIFSYGAAIIITRHDGSVSIDVSHDEMKAIANMIEEGVTNAPEIR